MARQRKAFTVIEIMIVISIILILMGMTLVGFRYVSKSAKTSATKTSLETMRSMMAELDSSLKGGLNAREPAFMWNSGVLKPNTGVSTFNIWKTADPTVASAPAAVPYMPQNASNAGNLSADNSNRFSSDMAMNSVVVMSLFMGSTVNRQTRDKVPAQNLLMVPLVAPWPAVTPTQPFDPSKYPLIADAWGNPILFVPASGLDIKDPVSATVLLHVDSPDKRPFFVSAGPDGMLSGISDPAATPADRQKIVLNGATDNIYSFEH